MQQRIFTTKRATEFSELGNFIVQVMSDVEGWKKTSSEIADATKVVAQARDLQTREDLVKAGADTNAAKEVELDARKIAQDETDLALKVREDLVKGREDANVAEEASLDKRDVELKVNEADYKTREAALKIAEAAAAEAKTSAEKAEAASLKTQADYNRALEGLKSVRV